MLISESDIGIADGACGDVTDVVRDGALGGVFDGVLGGAFEDACFVTGLVNVLLEIRQHLGIHGIVNT